MADIKEFKAEYLKDLDEREFDPALVPWINDPFLTWQNVIIDAINIPYDNTTSWLTATNVQAAIDELKTLIP